MENRGEDFDFEPNAPERGKLPPRLAELTCLLDMTSSVKIEAA